MMKKWPQLVIFKCRQGYKMTSNKTSVIFSFSIISLIFVLV